MNTLSYLITQKKTCMNWSVIFVFFISTLSSFTACTTKQEHKSEITYHYMTIDGRTITITGIHTEMKIPTHMQNLPVTIIGKKAFIMNRLTSVIIPSSVTQIGDYAFAGNNLTNVTLPPGIIRIGMGAFSRNQITDIIIPDSVRHIEAASFFHNQLSRLIIPNNVTLIGDDAFYSNRITSLAIGQSVRHIGNGAFENNFLRNIIIPNNVIHIDDYAFANNNITRIIIGSNVTLGSNAFDNQFVDFYNQNEKRAGTYIYNNGRWEYNELLFA